MAAILNNGQPKAGDRVRLARHPFLTGRVDKIEFGAAHMRWDGSGLSALRWESRPRHQKPKFAPSTITRRRCSIVGAQFLQVVTFPLSGRRWKTRSYGVVMFRLVDVQA